MDTLLDLSPRQQVALQGLLKYPGLIQLYLELSDIYLRICQKTKWKWLAKALAAYTWFNRWLAVRITNSVGTMTCAYLFSLLAFTGLPGAIHDSIQQGSLFPVDMWMSQNYIQLVLLPVIMVGQSIANETANQHKAAIADLHEKADGLVALQEEHGEKIDDLSNRHTALHEHVEEHLPKIKRQSATRTRRVSKNMV